MSVTRESKAEDCSMFPPEAEKLYTGFWIQLDDTENKTHVK